MSSELIKCQVCQNLNPKFQCKNCKSTKYCSKECQKVDWKYHKTNCVFTQIIKSLECDKCNKKILNEQNEEIIAIYRYENLSKTICDGCKSELVDIILNNKCYICKNNKINITNNIITGYKNYLMIYMLCDNNDCADKLKIELKIIK